MLYILIAIHEPAPGDVERLVLEYPGTLQQAAAYVSRHWPGTWRCEPPPPDTGKPMLLCEQRRAPMAENTTAPDGEPEADGETLFADDLDTKDGVYD